MAEDLRKVALERYLKSDGKCKLKDLAKELGLAYTTLTSWKARDSWKEILTQRRVQAKNAKKNAKKNTQNEEENTQEQPLVYTKMGKPAGHPGKVGLQNALGHGAPLGNKNTVKHGLYETLKYSDFTEEERELMCHAPRDLREYYLQIITECDVRERRMHARLRILRALEEGRDAEDILSEDEQNVIGVRDGVKVIKVKRNVSNTILAIQDALTKVAETKRKALDSYYKVQQEEQKIAIAQARLELDIKRFEQGESGGNVTVIISGEEELE